MRALVAERPYRYRAFPAMPLGDGSKALREQRKMIGRHARQFGCCHAPASEPEERVLIAEGAADEVSRGGGGPACWPAATLRRRV